MPQPSGAPARLIAVMCLAEVLGMLSNATFPALIPQFQALWSLSNTEAGWIGGVYYGGYVASVPLLVSLTDRRDARAIYLASTVLGGLAALGFAFLAEGVLSAMAFRLLGTGYVAPRLRKYRPFKQARAYVHTLNLKRPKEWMSYSSSGNRPKDIPSNPSRYYQHKGWINWPDWLGTATKPEKHRGGKAS